MNRLLLALSIIVLAFAPMGAQEASGDSLATIIRQLPEARDLKDYKNWLYPPFGIANPTVRDRRELKRAEEAIASAKILVPKLRSMIKVGTSIFDYPGLLAKGDTSYPYSSKNDYELYIGIYLRATEGSQEYDFKIIFDDKGIITQVRTVVYKR